VPLHRGVELGVAPARVRAGERRVDDLQDYFEVMARRDFGDDATVLGVQVELRCDDVRAQVAPVFDDRGGGFVAGRFDAEDEGSSCQLLVLSSRCSLLSCQWSVRRCGTRRFGLRLSALRTAQTG